MNGLKKKKENDFRSRKPIAGNAYSVCCFLYSFRAKWSCRLLAYIPCMCTKVHANASGGDKSDNFSLLSCLSCIVSMC